MIIVKSARLILHPQGLTTARSPTLTAFAPLKPEALAGLFALFLAG